MFSKKMVMIVGVVVLIAVNIIILSVNTKQTHPSYGLGRVALSLLGPFQEGVTHSVHFLRRIWANYFDLVSASMENAQLRKELNQALEDRNLYNETLLANIRYRNLLNFKQYIASPVLAAEVIGRDPSPWFKTIIVNKGSDDGVKQGAPVVVPEGIAGLVVEVASNYAKVLLIIDQNSAVDGLIQRTRSRGVIKGDSSGKCILKYVLRKHDVSLGDTVVSSGLDGVFPKGLRIGRVSEIVKLNAGIFQEILVTPYVDFEKLEEVLIVAKVPEHDFLSQP
ncbi:MAG: rod shape-determining protein MreC [Desulfobacteraceae bacterium]|jgi:rod shape-determining protein MreC